MFKPPASFLAEQASAPAHIALPGDAAGQHLGYLPGEETPPLAEGRPPVPVCGMSILADVSGKWDEPCSRVPRGQTLAAALAKAQPLRTCSCSAWHLIQPS